MKIIAIANQKGGVAKTTTAAALSAALSRKGYRVLAIDMDPQGNLSDSFGIGWTDHGTYSVLKMQDKIGDAILQTETCDILPATIVLAGIEQELNTTGRECRLREVIEAGCLESVYDYILCDTPPALGTLTINALVAADAVLIPTTADMSALKGIDQLNMTIQNVRKYFNRNLKIAGILFTRYNPRANISKQIGELTEKVANTFGTSLFKTFIRPSVVVSESSGIAQNLWAYKPSSTVAQDYDNFTDEFISRMEDLR